MLRQMYHSAEKKYQPLHLKILNIPVNNPDYIAHTIVKTAHEKVCNALRRNLSVASPEARRVSKALWAKDIQLWQGTYAWAEAFPQLFGLAAASLIYGPKPLMSLTLKAMMNSLWLRFFMAAAEI